MNENYRINLKNIVIPLIKERYPKIDVEKFSFNRQQIAEIFAMLYQREFCQRANENKEVHDRVEENVNKFAKDQEGVLAEFNSKHNRDCKIDEFYQENHILSLIVAPLLESKYTDFNKRVEIFWK